MSIKIPDPNMKIFDIQPPKRGSYIVTEHIMHSIAGLLIAQGLLLLMNMLLGGAHPVLNWEDGRQFLAFLETHTFVKVLLGFVAILLLNLFPIIRNLKKQHLMRLIFSEDEGMLMFELISLYSSKPKVKKVHMKNIVLAEEGVKVMGEGKGEAYHFAETNQQPFAFIDPRAPIWASYRPDILPGLEKLQRILPTLPK
ncbi:MAG: hypothetical protein AAFO96_08305 [Bacteroidota bacterium]